MTISGRLNLIVSILMVFTMFQVSSCSALSESEYLQVGTTTLNYSKLDLAETVTLPVVDTPTATVEPTVTATPKPTATETPELTPTENPYKNIGKFPLTLEREDIEENGLIIPFNPVDNPEEFMEYVRSIERKSGGYLGLINDLGGGGFDPATNKTVVKGEISRYIQVMFFEYNGKYFPVIKPWSSRGTLDDFSLLSDVWQYDNLSKNNVEGAKIKLVIFRDMDKTNPGSIAGQEMWDFAKNSGMAVSYIMELE
jgi:hypothetical protein